MNFKERFCNYAEKIKLESMGGETVFIRPLSPLERGKYFDLWRKAKDDNSMELAAEMNCYLVQCGLLDDDGITQACNDTHRADMIRPLAVFDELVTRIGKLSGMFSDEVDAEIKNSNPTTNDDSKSGLQQSSDGGTLTSS